MEFDKSTISNGSGLYSPCVGSHVKAEVECRQGDELVITCNNDTSSVGQQITIGEADSAVWHEVELCLMSMKLGEESEFIHKSSTRRYRIMLISFERGIDFWKLSADRKIEIATHHKQRGNELFKHGNVACAASRYSRALKYVLSISNDDTNSMESSNIKELKLQCFLNMSACHLKLCNHSFTVKTAVKALLLDETNVKALYRRAMANSAMGNITEAKEDLGRAKTYDPNNRAVTDELTRLQRKEKDSEVVLKDAMRKMFT